jgi:hypothetical protein
MEPTSEVLRIPVTDLVEYLNKSEVYVVLGLMRALNFRHDAWPLIRPVIVFIVARFATETFGRYINSNE